MTTNVIIGLRASFTTANLQQLISKKIAHYQKKLPDLINQEMAAPNFVSGGPARMSANTIKANIETLKFWKDHLAPDSMYLLSREEVNLVITLD